MNTNQTSNEDKEILESRNNSIEYTEEYDDNTNSATTSQDDSNRQNSFNEMIINETLNADEIVSTNEKTAMIVKSKPDKNAIIAESRIKAKQFDAEKLKPFFVEYKEEPREITDYDVCSNILLFIFVLLGLLLVFLCGLGVAVSNIF